MRDAASVTAHGLTHRFFLVPKLLIFFKGNQIFQTRSDEFLRRNKARRSGRPSISTIYFPSAFLGNRLRKIVAKFPGGRGAS